MTDTTNGTMTTADQIRSWIDNFPNLAITARGLLQHACAELDRMHEFAASQSERIAAQSDLLSRQKNAAKRCLAIARDEAAVYRDCLAARTAEDNAEGVHAAQAAMVACNRVADRIEGEVMT